MIMLKKILLILIISVPLCANAELLYGNGGYVSPESYAVNEADMRVYSYMEPSADILPENSKKIRHKKQSKAPKRVKTQEEYEKGIVYKTAKWWVDQRYKREEEHHGVKHEIKVKAREEYEKRMTEQPKEETN